MQRSSVNTYTHSNTFVVDPTDFSLEVAKASLHALLTEAITLPQCITITKLLIRLERVRNVNALGYVIRETYLFLESLQKALEMAKFHEIISRQNMRKVQELNHFEFKHELENVQWHTIYNFQNVPAA